MSKKTAKPPKAKEVVEIIRQKNPELASLLDKELLSILLSEALIEDYPPNDILMKQHDVSDSMFILLSGRCMILVNDQPLQQLEAGDIVGEMGIIQKTPRTATVKAIEKTRVLKVPDYVFRKMLKTQALSSWVINLLTERLKRSSQNAASILKEMDEMVLDQMELARVQRSLLPKELPDDPRFRVHVLYSPCAYAGGDYYDCMMLDDNTLFMMVADVTGHGAQASISMAIVRSFIHQGKFGKSPGTVLKRLNKYLFENGPASHFVTAQVVVVDLKKMKLHYAYAGHPPLLHLRKSECNPLTGPRAFFLRFRPNAEFKSSTLTLKPGDRFAFYTDGIIETFNPEGTMLNIEGLARFMRENSKVKADSLPNALETWLHEFTEGSPMEDDLTFMVLEIK